MKEWWESVKEWFEDDFKYPSCWWGIKHVRYFFEYAHRILDFIPVLWTNHDFDSHYALILLRYKLGRIRDCIAENQRHEEWVRDVNNIGHAMMLIQRILDDDYCNKEFAAFHEKWPFEILVDERGRHYTPSMSDEERAEWTPIHEKYCADRERDWHDLWKLLDEHMKEWWD